LQEKGWLTGSMSKRWLAPAAKLRRPSRTKRQAECGQAMFAALLQLPVTYAISATK
jgi:hypothetical protein